MKGVIISVGLALVLVLAAVSAGARTVGPPMIKLDGTAAVMTVAGYTNNDLVSGLNSGPGWEPVRARRCGSYWVRGHYNRWGNWVPPHKRYRHWVRGHYDRWGNWVPGHCA